MSESLYPRITGAIPIPTFNPAFDSFFIALKRASGMGTYGSKGLDFSLVKKGIEKITVAFRSTKSSRSRVTKGDFVIIPTF